MTTQGRTYADVVPLDGTWATDGTHAGVYCGVCHRWVDALTVDEGPGDVKLRHYRLVHS